MRGTDGRLKQGDQVSRDTSQGRTQGQVEAKLTSPRTIKGHKAKASASDPQCLVKSDKTGAGAAHRLGELTRDQGRSASS